MRLVLNSIENTRKTLGRIIRMYSAGKMQQNKAKDLTYMLQTYLSYYRSELGIEDKEDLKSKIKKKMNESL